MLYIFSLLKFLVQFMKGGSPMGDTEPVSLNDLEPFRIEVSEIRNSK